MQGKEEKILVGSSPISYLATLTARAGIAGSFRSSPYCLFLVLQYILLNEQCAFITIQDVNLKCHKPLILIISANFICVG